MQRISDVIPKRIWTLAVFFALSYCSSTFAIDPTSIDPVNQQMKINRIVTQKPTKKVSPRDYIVAVNNGTQKVMSNLHARKTIKSEPPHVVTKQMKSPARTKAPINKKRQKQPIPPLPEISPPIEPINLMPEIFYYKPSIDFAQYALHQGNVRSANLVEAFIPIGRWMFDNVLFLDARFYNPNGTPVEGNVDLGFRHLFSQGNKLFGLYAGYDRYRSETRRYYNQANAGLELWLKRFFMGGNVYIPFGTTTYDNDNLNVAYLVPTDISYRYNIAFEQGKERAMPGGDAEVGVDMSHGLTIYVGGYYFDHSNAKRIAGPKCRATYTLYRSQAHRLLHLFDRIRLEGLISHDSVRGTSWMAGLRFRFGLSKHPNPTAGVARHMTDPIRRDLNVVSENFNAADEFYKIDDRPARVDLVSSTSGRTIDAAVSGNADIIGIRGDQTTAGGLVLGDRDLIITGGDFFFSVDGHPYTIQSVGQNGRVVTTNSAFANIFDWNDAAGTHNLTLKYLTFAGNNTTNDSGFVLDTESSAFNQIIVDHTVSSLPFNFSLENTSDSLGKVSFTHNVLNIVDAQLSGGSSGEFGAVRFMTDADSQLLIVNDFSYNQINITNRTTGSDASGLYVWANSSTPIHFSHGILYNTINVSDNSGISGDAYGFYQDNADFNDNIQGNVFTASDNAHQGYGWWIYIIEGDTTIYGDVRDNTFTASGNTIDGFGWCIYIIEGDTTIYGDVRDNTFTASGNNAGFGWLIEGDTTITGDVRGNTFTASGNNGSSGIGWLIEKDTTIGGDVRGNTFTASGNTESFSAGWEIEEDTTIGGDVRGNTFTASGNNAGYGWWTEGDTTIGGDVRGNTFTASGNTDAGYGWWIGSKGGTTIDGDISGNQFIVTDNNNDNIGLYISLNSGETVTFKKAITSNTLQIDGSTTTTGFDFIARPGSVINFEQAIENNLFLINANPSGLTGINMDTTDGGTINLKGNTDQDQLGDVNNEAKIVADEGAGTICYGGSC